jgi:hypothetical protein
MKKKFLLGMLILATIMFACGAFFILVPNENVPYLDIVLMAGSGLIFLGTMILAIATSRRRFKFNIKFILKVLITIAAFISFTVGLTLFLVFKVIILGVILLVIGFCTFLFLIPMFVAFVRANPLEHVIITPNYDDIDTDFFIDK